jgi:hypothetical protein
MTSGKGHNSWPLVENVIPEEGHICAGSHRLTVIVASPLLAISGGSVQSNAVVEKESQLARASLNSLLVPSLVVCHKLAPIDGRNMGNVGNVELVSNEGEARGRRCRMIKISPFTAERFSRCEHLIPSARSRKDDKIRKQPTTSSGSHFLPRVSSSSPRNPGNKPELERSLFHLTQ